VPDDLDSIACPSASLCLAVGNESIDTSDRTGLHTVDSTKLPGGGPYLTDLTLTGDVLTWNHAGTLRSVTLAH